MKNIKQMFAIVLAAVSVIGFCSSVQAVDNFEILNKSTKAIKVIMRVFRSSKGTDEPVFSVPAGLAARKNIIIPSNQPLFLMIQEEGMTKMAIFKRINVPTGKTMYITFNPQERPTVYPQTGTYAGLSGQTSTGLSLKNNISKSDIVEASMANFRD